MIGIVVTGHAHFPSGLLSAVELVAGKPEDVVGIDFESGQSSDDLRAALKTAVELLEGEEVLILADLVGGTPFNTAVLLKEQIPEKKIRVLAGINMAGMVEAVFSRNILPFEALAEQVKTAAADGVVSLDDLSADSGEAEFEDGL